MTSHPKDPQRYFVAESSTGVPHLMRRRKGSKHATSYCKRITIPVEECEERRRPLGLCTTCRKLLETKT